MTYSKAAAGESPVYKFVEPPSVAQFLERGSVRIGTIHDFRNMELAHRRDKSEGFASAFVERLHIDGTSPSPIAALHVEGNANVIINGGTFNTVLPNVYCFCTSSAIEAAPAGPHAAFQIDDIVGLGLALKRLYPQLGKSMRTGPVHYLSLDGHQAPHYAVKDTSFSHEREIRMIWDEPERAPMTIGPGDCSDEALAIWREAKRAGGIATFNTEPSDEIAAYLKRLY